MVALTEAEAEEMVQGLTRVLGGAVEEGEVQCAFAGHGEVGNLVEPGHAARDVCEGKLGRIQPRERVESAGHRLPIQDGGSGLAERGGAIAVVHFHDNGSVGARSFAAGNFPRVGEPELARAGINLHQ